MTKSDGRLVRRIEPLAAARTTIAAIETKTANSLNLRVEVNMQQGIRKR